MREISRFVFCAVGMTLLTFATASYAEDKPTATIELVNNTQKKVRVSIIYQACTPPANFVLEPGDSKNLSSTDPKPKFVINYSNAEGVKTTPGLYYSRNGPGNYLGLFSEVAENNITLVITKTATAE